MKNTDLNRVINVLNIITDIFDEKNISVDESLIITSVINDMALSYMEATKYDLDSIFLDPNLLSMEH